MYNYFLIGMFVVIILPHIKNPKGDIRNADNFYREVVISSKMHIIIRYCILPSLVE